MILNRLCEGAQRNVVIAFTGVKIAFAPSQRGHDGPRPLERPSFGHPARP